jgi:hypothetical protein
MVDHGDIYKVVNAICWEREKNGSYKGNSHHLSQEITEAVMEVIGTPGETKGESSDE